jgi:hypothetical protein
VLARALSLDLVSYPKTDRLRIEWRHLEQFLNFNMTSTKVYVTGKFADAFRVSIIAETLENDFGYSITSKWFEKALLLPDIHDVSACSNVFMSDCAVENLQGVFDADLMVVLMDDPLYAYQGTWAEIGAALQLRTTVLVIIPDNHGPTRNSFFLHHPKVRCFEGDDKLMEYLMVS